ncbi:hypothetical protein QWY85_03370 [Neolewinella lacunae]|uniref:Uncharacterized protein n=1 Tax=Neolewinella lacunae TaxID=1517758 RepID=A0A923PJ21_9BACT|nr:hypothetical protein [Neolewinella lacunae]MBC6992626.1 hypothetical protein [Neolewinella lacunae]MDN3633681.1 hypothetical protein [Neolewinella lacunae]
MKDFRVDICTLNGALVGCVTDNLLSASFEYVDDRVKLKLVYREPSMVDAELEEDIVTDFCALSGYMDKDFLKDYPIVFFGEHELSLEHKVYLAPDSLEVIGQKID